MSGPKKIRKNYNTWQYEMLKSQWEKKLAYQTASG